MQLSWQSIGPARHRRRFDSPERQGIFLPESTFNADSLTVSVHPRVQSRALTSVRTLKILQSMSEFGGLWKHSNTQHASQVEQRDSVTNGIPRGKQPEFTITEILVGQQSCKIHTARANYQCPPSSPRPTPTPTPVFFSSLKCPVIFAETMHTTFLCQIKRRCLTNEIVQIHVIEKE